MRASPLAILVLLAPTLAGPADSAQAPQEIRFDASVDHWIAAEVWTSAGDVDVALYDPSGRLAGSSRRPPGLLDAVGRLAHESGEWRLVVTPLVESRYDVTLRVDPPLALGRRADGPVVAVLDTGIDPRHPEFATGQIVAWRDFAGDVDGARRAVAYDDHRHGTATASLAAGAALGAHPGTALAVGKVLDRHGGGAWDAVIEGIRWADGTVRADVILLSLGATFPTPGATMPTLMRALEDARANGTLVVVANGNKANSPGDLHAPSSSRSVLSVAHADERGRPAGDASWNPEVTAWGENACVARASGAPAPAAVSWCRGGERAYGYASGSSFAAARVAGWAAAMREAGADASAASLERALACAARDDPATPYAREGHGHLDAEAVAKALRILAGDEPCALDADDAANLLSDMLKA